MTNGKAAKDIAYAWWNRLNAPGNSAGRAAKARLRRAESPVEVFSEPAAVELADALRGCSPERVAALAAVLADVVADDTAHATVAQAIGRKQIDDDKSAIVSEGRFKRLMKLEDHELVGSFRRIVRMLKGELPIRDLAASILFWNDQTKLRWTFQYYGAATPRSQDTDV